MRILESQPIHLAFLFNILRPLRVHQKHYLGISGMALSCCGPPLLCHYFGRAHGDFHFVPTPALLQNSYGVQIEALLVKASVRRACFRRARLRRAPNLTGLISKGRICENPNFRKTKISGNQDSRKSQNPKMGAKSSFLCRDLITPLRGLFFCSNEI